MITKKKIAKIAGMIFDGILYFWLACFALAALIFDGSMATVMVIAAVIAFMLAVFQHTVIKRSLGFWFFGVGKEKFETGDYIKLTIGIIIIIFTATTLF